jgi:hypothetical protein
MAGPFCFASHRSLREFAQDFQAICGAFCAQTADVRRVLLILEKGGSLGFRQPGGVFLSNFDRTDDIYGKNLHELDLAGLAELCGNVVNNHSADHRQSDTARRLRAERVQLDVRFLDDKTEPEASLRKRMLEFLSGVPGWMMSGV